mmetsp:Transcript_16207/g.28624  ORF Transcript_16207/g.28624 Transcript_16207/m.28624 type:complete len:290 (+) Transcript_16207:126-995(+)
MGTCRKCQQRPAESQNIGNLCWSCYSYYSEMDHLYDDVEAFIRGESNTKSTAEIAAEFREDVQKLQNFGAKVLAYYRLMLRNDYADYVTVPQPLGGKKLCKNFAKNWYRMLPAFCVLMATILSLPITCVVFGFSSASRSSAECKDASSWLMVVGWFQLVSGLSCLMIFTVLGGGVTAIVGRGLGKPLFIAIWLYCIAQIGWSIHGLTYLQNKASGCAQMSQFAYAYAWTTLLLMSIILFCPPWIDDVIGGESDRNHAHQNQARPIQYASNNRSPADSDSRPAVTDYNME